MASLGMFGGSAPRIRRLQPMANPAPSIQDMQRQTMEQMQAAQAAQAEEMKRAQAAQMSNEPAPGSGPVANTPTFPLFGSSAPKSGTLDPKKAIPMSGEASGYQPGKRDWWKEISSDPLGFFLTGTDGLSSTRNEGLMSDYARQAAEESELQRQARTSQAGVLGLTGRDADLYVNAGEDYYKAYAESQKPSVLGEGALQVRGFGEEDVYNPKTLVSDGQVLTTNKDGTSTWGDRRADTPSEILAAAKAKQPIIQNTGQAIVSVNPDGSNSRVLYQDAKAEGSSGDQYRPATPQEKLQYGIAPDVALTINTRTNKPDVLLNPKAAAQYSPTEIRTFRSTADGLKIMRNAVNNYIEELTKTGPKLISDPWDKEGVQRLNSAHGLITSAIKDADKLGALDQGVQNLVNAIIQNPIGLGTFGTSAESITEGANEVLDSITFRMSLIPEEYREGSAGAPVSGNSKPPNMDAMQLGIRAYSKKTGIPADALTMLIADPTPENIAQFNQAAGRSGLAESILKDMRNGR